MLRDHVTLLHLPTTSVLMLFAVLGSTFAEFFHLDRFLLYEIQIFLGGGIAANYLDELLDRPWKTKISRNSLWFVAIASLLGFLVIGLYFTFTVSTYFILFVIIESFLILAYNLELFGGIFHNSNFLGISWGLVFIAGYFLQEQYLPISIIIIFLILCIASMRGIDLYEQGKIYGKDRIFADHHARSAWKALMTCIIIFNAAVLLFAAWKLTLFFG